MCVLQPQPAKHDNQLCCTCFRDLHVRIMCRLLPGQVCSYQRWDFHVHWAGRTNVLIAPPFAFALCFAVHVLYHPGCVPTCRWMWFPGSAGLSQLL